MPTPLLQLLGALPEPKLRKVLFTVHPEIRELPLNAQDLLDWVSECGDEPALRACLQTLEGAEKPAPTKAASAPAAEVVIPRMSEAVYAQLEKRLNSFGDATRERGEEEASLVGEIHFQPASRSWTGKSQGADRFALMATERGRAGCTCPRFQKHGECRHVAAFLVRLLREGRPSAPARVSAPPAPKEDLAALSRLRRFGHEEGSTSHPLNRPTDTARSLRTLQEVVRELRNERPEVPDSRMHVVYFLEDKGEGRVRQMTVVPRTETVHDTERATVEDADLCTTFARRSSMPKYVSSFDEKLIRDCEKIRANEHRYGYGSENVRYGNWHEMIERMASTRRLRSKFGEVTVSPHYWRLVPDLRIQGNGVHTTFRLHPLETNQGSILELGSDWYVFGSARERLVYMQHNVYPLDPRTSEAVLRLCEGNLSFDLAPLRNHVPDLQTLASVGVQVDAELLPPRFVEPPQKRIQVDMDTPGKIRLRYQPSYPTCGPLDVDLPSDLVAFTLADGRLAEQERDRNAEKLVRQQMLETFAELDLLGEAERDARVLVGEDVIRRFALESIPDLEARGWTVAGTDSLRSMRTRQGTLRMKAKPSGIDWFEISGTADFGGIEVPLSQLVAAQLPDVVELPDGTLGQLPQALLRRLRWLSRLGNVTGAGVNLSRWHAGLAEELVESGEADAEDPASWAELLQSLAENTEMGATEVLPVPTTLRAELRPYQKQGLDWLWDLRQRQTGGILADDMGLGKTVQVISLLCRIFEREGAEEPMLVIAPASVAGNWVSEMRKFAPHIETRFMHGLRREELRDAPLTGPTVFVTTYGILPREDMWIEEKRFSVTVLDESQSIRNPLTAAHQSCLRLNSRQKLCLTGTPVENSLGDLWSQFAFLNPGLLGPRDVFLQQFNGTGGTPPDLERLRRLTAAFWLRRTKEVVAPELPERSDVELRVDLEPRQRELYRRQLAEVQTSLLSEVEANGVNNENRFQILTALLRLRQIACAPELAGHAGPSAKLDLLIDKLTEDVAEGHKALVFSSFTSLLDLTQARLTAAGIPCLRLDGSTPARERTRLVERFQKGGHECVFLISLKAGGAGINLTGADYVFLLDPWWNPAAEEQAASRSHRIGQKNPVVVYRMIARDTVEERILELARNKRQLAKDLFDSGDTGGAALTTDLVRELLG